MHPYFSSCWWGVKFASQSVDAFQSIVKAGAAQGHSGNQCLNLSQRWNQGVEGLHRRHRRTDDQISHLAQR
jgi:hypothetical protein